MIGKLMKSSWFLEFYAKDGVPIEIKWEIGKIFYEI